MDIITLLIAAILSLVLIGGIFYLYFMIKFLFTYYKILQTINKAKEDN